MEIIKFYKVKDQYGFLSNFAPYPIYVRGEIWNTVEHFFQANKFESFEAREIIKNCKTAIDAAQKGRMRDYPLRNDWENIKDDIMYQGLIAKFMQHPNIKVKLLNTKDAYIVEHTSNDNYWADGGDGSGKNMLGILLMKVREKILSSFEDIEAVFPPWLSFPGLSENDLFWRMGFGEDYIDQWVEYYRKYDNKDQYKSNFPEDTDWKGFYSYFIME